MWDMFSKKYASEAATICTCFERLRESKARLEKEMEPMPELNRVPLGQLKESVTAWSFEDMVRGKLQQRGWPVAAQAGQSPELTDVLFVLGVQSEGRFGKMNVGAILRDYLKPDHQRGEATAFFLSHLSDLVEVAAEIETMRASEIDSRHTLHCVAPKQDISLPPRPQNV